MTDRKRKTDGGRTSEKERAGKRGAQPAPQAVEEAAALSKIVTMRNGKRYRVLGEDGKYYYLGGTQIRKSNPDIANVKVG